ncbi:MAG: glycosyltransferase [Actinomycetota bacterium]|nr:glycosyltransferase [Actinomycetota bacterium]
MKKKKLPSLIKSIKKQNFKLKEIILVDDGSRDFTPDIGRKFKIKVITLNKSPRGWIGKSWACYNGAKIATGDYLLFLDADTMLCPGAIEKISSCLYKYRGAVSIQPYRRIKKFYENLSLFFNIILIAGIGVSTPLQSRVRPIGAFGPCLICSRSDYFKVQGHRGIKGKVLEDIEIGKKL